MTKTIIKPKRIAIITGASSGIGEATALLFVQQGIGVIGNARNAEKLAAMEQKLGCLFAGIPGDASEHGIAASLFDAAIARFGRPADIVIANAGRGLGGSVRNADLAQFSDRLKLNVEGVLALMQHAAKAMTKKARKAACEAASDIVVIGSVVGRNISPFSAVYGATKFAVHALAEGLRREIGPEGVRVSLIEPGIVLSGFQEAAGYSDTMVDDFHKNFGPLLTAKDVADAIYYVISQPPAVHISNIVVRPTRQAYP